MLEKKLDPRYLMLDGHVKVQHPDSNSFNVDVFILRLDYSKQNIYAEVDLPWQLFTG
mgnify:CR=1 FL=1